MALNIVKKIIIRIGTEEGQSLVEYGIILALIVIVCVGAVLQLTHTSPF